MTLLVRLLADHTLSVWVRFCYREDYEFPHAWTSPFRIPSCRRQELWVCRNCGVWTRPCTVYSQVQLIGLATEMINWLGGRGDTRRWTTTLGKPKNLIYGRSGKGSSENRWETAGHVVIYVDDILAVGPQEVVEGFLGKVTSTWTCSAATWFHRETVKFCGFEIRQENDKIRVNQQAYAEELCSRYDCQKTRTWVCHVMLDNHQKLSKPW